MTYIYEIEHKEGGSLVDITVAAKNLEEAVKKVGESYTSTGCISIKRVHELFSYSDTPTKTDKL